MYDETAENPILSIDLNCDMGEGCANDEALMPYISSANIACGAQAGDAPTMRRTIELAIEHGVAVGAHPGYHDRENFGRRDHMLTPDEIARLVTGQLELIASIAKNVGTVLNHVKPHGALYNQSGRDRAIATAIAKAVSDFDPGLILVGLAGSRSISAAETFNLMTAREAFADRTYLPDGSLTPRSHQRALITNPAEAGEQFLSIVTSGNVTAVDGSLVSVEADTVCIHGDGPRALAFAKTINDMAHRHGIDIRPLNRKEFDGCVTGKLSSIFGSPL